MIICSTPANSPYKGGSELSPNQARKKKRMSGELICLPWPQINLPTDYSSKNGGAKFFCLHGFWLQGWPGLFLFWGFWILYFSIFFFFFLFLYVISLYIGSKHKVPFFFFMKSILLHNEIEGPNYSNSRCLCHLLEIEMYKPTRTINWICFPSFLLCLLAPIV